MHTNRQISDLVSVYSVVNAAYFPPAVETSNFFDVVSMLTCSAWGVNLSSTDLLHNVKPHAAYKLCYSHVIEILGMMMLVFDKNFIQLLTVQKRFLFKESVFLLLFFFF